MKDLLLVLLDFFDIVAAVVIRYVLPVIAIVAIAWSSLDYDGTENAKVKMVWSVGALLIWGAIRLKYPSL